MIRRVLHTDRWSGLALERPEGWFVENRKGVLEGLAAMGHPLTPTEPFDSWLGHCHAIELVDGGPAEDGTLAAATDPRSAGLPATW